MSHVTKKARFTSVLTALLLVAVQLFAPISALVPAVAAAPVCSVDSAGPNDVPGQKDLTKLCVDYANKPVSIQTSWNWDELGTTGNNTMDACNLFDTNGDGNANYAVCVSTHNTPATFLSLTTYSCGDTRYDRCTSTNAIISNGSTTCDVSQQNTDPFPSDASYPFDTQGQCTISLSAIGGATAKLIDVCSYPSGQPNSDPSDCVLAHSNSAKIEVIKSLSPANDSGRFDLKIGSTIYATNIGDGGTTGQQIITADSHTSLTILEQANSTTNATSLNNYSTTVVCKDQHGTGTTIASSSPTDGTSRQLSFTPSDGQDVICTFTNTRLTGTITLIKNVINNNGGTATANDFGLSIGGTTVTSGQTLTLTGGAYAINEAGKSGYAFSAISGTGCPAQLGGSVNLTNGQNLTCTITNDDITAKLKVVKSVVNNNGGTALASDFTMNVNGTAVAQNQYINENVGSYTITESGPSGYTQTGIACVDDTTNQAVSYPINLNLGQVVTCAVTNDDATPSLTVIKHVVNDNGGTNTAADFTMGVTGSNVSQTSFAGSESGTTVTLNAGNYSVGESGPSGYAATYSADCSGTIALGAAKTCTITNNDIVPILTLVKSVINDNGGTKQVSDFSLFVNTTQVTSGVANTFNAGNYTVSEANLAGYTAGTWGGNCSAQGTITLVIGNSYTCTITNNDQPGTLIVQKVVVNDNGGTKSASDFSFSVNNGTAQTFNANGENDLTVNAGTYTVTETAVSGYASSYNNCTNVVIPNGGSATCTITNDDIAPSLTLNKIVSNTHGGSAAASDWTLTASGPSTLSGPGVDNSSTDVVSDSSFTAGTYTLSESGSTTGYLASAWTCDNNVVVSNNQITLANGQTTTCTITNSDVAPILTVIKQALNPYGTALPASSFPLYVDGNSVTTGVPTSSFSAGTHTISETQQKGYAFTGVNGDCTIDSETNIISIILGLGQNSSCTLTNTAIQPKLIVIKHVVNDNGGTKSASDFTMTVSGNSATVANFPGDENGTTVYLNEGSYAVDELTNDGYTKSFSSDCSGTISIGETKTCTITNDDQPGTLIVQKVVVNPYGGTAQASDFGFTVNGGKFQSFNVDGENDLTVDAGTYTVSEPSYNGYDTTYDNCTEISVANGETATCTITNTDAPAQLTIVKHAYPTADTTFNFTSDTLGNFSLSGDGTTAGSKTFSLLSVGAYTIAEQATDHWYNLSISCNNRTFSFNSSVTVNLGLGDNVTCTVYNAEKSSVTGYKFDDVNKNGVWDKGEPTLKDWTIQLFQPCFDIEAMVIEGGQRCGSTPITTTQTDLTGAYSFSDLYPGPYMVCEVQQAGWTQTYPIDNNGCHSFFIEGNGQSVSNTNFGNFKKGEVTGVKFNDVNGNAKRDTDEPTLKNWEITLTKLCVPTVDTIARIAECHDTAIGKVLTDAVGAYSFSDLETGTYKVCETMQDKWTQTYPATADGCYQFVIATSGQIVTADFGNHPKPQLLHDELVTTGSDAMVNVAFGLVILGALAGLHLANRRQTIAR